MSGKSLLNFNKEQLDYIKNHSMTYDKVNACETMERLVEDIEVLRDQLSELCPIGDLDTIQSLLVEKQFMIDEISSLNKIIEQKNKAFDLLMDRAQQVEYERDNLRNVLRKLGVSEEQEYKLMMEVQQNDIELEDN